ncbi:hypothetical protein SAMN05421841_1149 [Chryseobacterium wanjuense]|uniref:Uncharacterized protein n=1 Tax=Chryseobacterium wanjuense TaxID=356305 RepID=A0A1I0PDJ5_9FLAO|nr:hypothetical protein [Chryseobacterium wanjuense]SEW12224.1 hypothetical protein SAMN05421841_1149 [Chryseobacterium wanjuense]
MDFGEELNVKLFRFSEEQKKQIFKLYDKLCEFYKVSVIDIKDSPLFQFKPIVENKKFVPEICYLIESEGGSVFYLYIVTRLITYHKKYGNTEIEVLEIWGLKELDENYENISIYKKTFADHIVGFFNIFDIHTKDDSEFDKKFCILGKNKNKTLQFLNSKRRKELIKKFPDEDFKLEVKNNILSFGLQKELTNSRALQISKFLKEM